MAPAISLISDGRSEEPLVAAEYVGGALYGMIGVCSVCDSSSSNSGSYLRLQIDDYGT